MKKVGIVILNYKVKELTLKCIKSVLDSSYKNISIFVVDNNSKDNVEEVLKKYPLTFLQNEQNLGYSGGNNIGIKAALKTDVDYIFILNPDTTIEENTIEILVKKAQELKSDILNPKIYFADSKRIWFAGKKFDKSNVLGTHIGVNEEDKGQFDKDEELEDATGAALFISRAVFEKIGLFDERYFLYYEETDFVFRAKKAGFKIMYIHQAIVYHKNAQSTGLGSPLQDYFITRNRMLFASKFLSIRTQFALIREAIRNSNNSAKRKALFDYLLGNFGKGSFAI